MGFPSQRFNHRGHRGAQGPLSTGRDASTPQRESLRSPRCSAQHDRFGVRDRDTLPFASRAQPGSFSDAQIGLLQTFADQAVIAIENVRLFRVAQYRHVEVASVSDALEQITHKKMYMSHRMQGTRRVVCIDATDGEKRDSRW